MAPQIEVYIWQNNASAQVGWLGPSEVPLDTIFVLDGLLWAEPCERKEQPLLIKCFSLNAQGLDPGIPIHSKSRVEPPTNAVGPFKIRRETRASRRGFADSVIMPLIWHGGHDDLLVVIHSVLCCCLGIVGRFRLLAEITVVLLKAEMV